MADVLAREAEEKACSREAIAALRRPAMKSKPVKAPGTIKPSAIRDPPRATVVAAKLAMAASHNPKCPERRVRNLRPLPDGLHSSCPRMRKEEVQRRGSSCPSTGSIAPANGETVDRSSTDVRPSSSACDADGDSVEEAVGWTSFTGRRQRGRGRGGSILQRVKATGVFPNRLSCGYCRKVFRVEILNRHEERCPSRNLELFATPCVACGFQGPRCACWALRNGLLKVIRPSLQKPLFNLFKDSTRLNKDTAAATNGDYVTKSAAAGTGKAILGLRGGWAAGGGLRRPVPLVDVRGDSNDGQAHRETAEERWKRERDEWLFGRVTRDPSASKEPRGDQPSTPSKPRAPSYDPSDGDGGREVHDLKQSDAAREKDDKAFLMRERIQMNSYFDRIRDAARVRQYAERWFKFSAEPPESIRHGDIPWLPRLSPLSGGGYLGRSRMDSWSQRDDGQKEKFETLGVNEGDSIDVKKAALRAASLRWHPDKFMSKYGPKIAMEDRGKIANDVQATMQRITELKERLLHEQADAARTKAHLFSPGIVHMSPGSAMAATPRS